MVEVKGAPGYADFEAEVILTRPRADGVLVCIVGDPEGEVHVIEAEYVFLKGEA